VRDETGAAARGVSGKFLPARVTDVRTSQRWRLVEEQRVIRLFVGKRLGACLAGVRADWMFHSFMAWKFNHE